MNWETEHKLLYLSIVEWEWSYIFNKKVIYLCWISIKLERRSTVSIFLIINKCISRINKYIIGTRSTFLDYCQCLFRWPLEVSISLIFFFPLDGNWPSVLRSLDTLDFALLSKILARSKKLKTRIMESGKVIVYIVWLIPTY